MYFLLLGDSLYRAACRASAATDALISVYLVMSVALRYCVTGTACRASAATDAFV